MVLSSAMCTQAFGVYSMPAALASETAPGSATPSIRPPLVSAELCRKPRRVRLVILVMAVSSGLVLQVRGRALDRGADAWVGAAATDVAAHRGVDLGIARVLVRLQQRGRAHQL